MNLLVTGGAGFIGSNLIRQIIDRPEIRRLINLDCLTYAGHPANVEDVARHPKYLFEQVDLRDKPAVVRVVGEHAITHVLHLAAESHVDRSIIGPDDFIHTNIVGTFHLLEACRARWLNSQFSILNSQSSPPLHPCLHRRSLWQPRFLRFLHRGDTLRPQLSLFRQQGRQRHARARLPSHL